MVKPELGHKGRSCTWNSGTWIGLRIYNVSLVLGWHAVNEHKRHLKDILVEGNLAEDLWFCRSFFASGKPMTTICSWFPGTFYKQTIRMHARMLHCLHMLTFSKYLFRRDGERPLASNSPGWQGVSYEKLRCLLLFGRVFSHAWTATGEACEWPILSFQGGETSTRLACRTAPDQSQSKRRSHRSLSTDAYLRNSIWRECVFINPSSKSTLLLLLIYQRDLAAAKWNDLRYCCLNYLL